jgi:hypothetical protein
MTQRYHERFGIVLGVTEAKRRFVNRVHNFFLGVMKKASVEGQAELERYLCHKLGERYKTFGSWPIIIGEDFDTCLLALEALHAHNTWKEIAAYGIQSILADTEIDIGIRWDGGQFIPTGAPALDERLVSDVLGILQAPAYRGISDAFNKGLGHLLHSLKKPELLSDVITDMYEAVEALAKIVCANDKDLSANREALISKLDLADAYRKILKEYIEYANDLHRHAGEKGQAKPLPVRREVEAFLYLTGLLIRMALSPNE